MKNLKSAFTLAEVLVTLGIIGVVSAMTIPTLVQNYQRESYVTQLHKVYNELSQATQRALHDTNAVSLAETRYNESNNNAASDFLHTYFNIVNDCGASLTPCFANQYNRINGEEAIVSIPDDLADKTTVVALASGASICMFGGFDNDDDDYHGYTQVTIDINGAKGPNITGRDVFFFEIYSDGKVDVSYSLDAKTGRDRGDVMDLCRASGYGEHCTTLILLDNWRMTY